MRWGDFSGLALGAARSHGLRSWLSALGIAVGVAAVLLLVSIAEGTRRFLLHEFTQFGTRILTIYPGKIKTRGIPGALGGTTHKLTLEDSQAIARIDSVEAVAPWAYGQARVEGNKRGRSVYVYGVTPETLEVWRLTVGQGAFLPGGDPRQGALVTVLGARLKRELFGDENALGRFVRAGGMRLRVVGVLAPKGRILGFEVDDASYVPVSIGMQMFNLDELQEIDVLLYHESLTRRVEQSIREVLVERHGGREDFTIVTQSAMLRALDNVTGVIVLALGGVAGISLVVGAIGVFSVMWIAVAERVHEIGVLRALGSSAREVQGLFLLEAMGITLVGGVLGVVTGFTVAWLLRTAVPGLPVHTPAGYVLLALVVSTVTGLFAGVAPARRAAAMDPADALRSE